MKHIKLLLMLLLTGYINICPTQSRIKNVIIVTTDGMRWQEIFNGADRKLANDKAFNQSDSATILKKYWDENSEVAREKLLPFIWGTIAKQGQIYGNRVLGNNVNTANTYWFSYPGYNEIFTGYPDPQVNSNNYKNNPNETLLDFLNKQPQYKNHIGVFASWDAFDRIFNKPRAGFPIIAAFENTGEKKPTTKEDFLNKMLADSYKPFGKDECLDVFTHYAATEYLKNNKPRVLYISYGETDEWAHAGKYRAYLEAAQQVDKWLSNIWDYIQSDPFYKDQTALIVTTDHGRGVNAEWTDHGSDIKGASEIWFAIMGPGIAAKGEIKQPMQNYQKQLAQTIASLLGTTFVSDHPIGDKIDIPLK